MEKLSDQRVETYIPLPSPSEYGECLSTTPGMAEMIVQHRAQIAKILRGEDPRLLVVVGPCSVHDAKSALEYAQRLADLAHTLRNLFLVMRVYVDKPRTSVGWEGLIYDPHLTGEFDVEGGLYAARDILVQIAKFGLPAGTEFVDPIIPQYLSDLISWAAIGARTTESQTHRRLASGLSMPVGFKNGTSGDVQVAIDAIVAAGVPHGFPGVNKEGMASMVITKGNPNCHLVLRGGKGGPNYDRQSVAQALQLLGQAKVCPYLMIDCAHGNNGKDHKRQPPIFREILIQRVAGNGNVVGIMMESNLFEGSQRLADKVKPSELGYGVSITDPCIGWDETRRLLLEADHALQEVLVR